MAYRIDVTLLDIDSVFGGAIPVWRGTLTGVLPGTSIRLPADPAVAIPGASMSVLFPGALSGVFPASVLLSDAGAATGQLFRSGEITLPASPAQLTLYSAVGGISPAELATFGASLSGTQLPTPVPDWQKLLLGLFLTFGAPETVTVTSASVTPAAGSLSISISGSVTYRLLFFIPFTQSFTIRTSVAITPSGDGVRTDRVVSVVPTGTTLTLMGTPAAIPIPFSMLNGTLTNTLEPLVNRAIVNAVDAILRARNPPMRRTPTCVISARKVGIAASGITAQIMLADFGTAIAPLPRTLALSVTPAPVPNTQQAYTFHVADKASHDSVAGATVVVTNHNPSATQSGVTDAHGDTRLTLALHAQTLGAGAHVESGPTVLQPYAVATAPGAQAATLVLTVVELA
jgi:hypothetical protein